MLLWHLKQGHMSEKRLKELEKQGALGKDRISAMGFCDECILGKSSRTRLKKYNAFNKRHFRLYTCRSLGTLTD